MGGNIFFSIFYNGGKLSDPKIDINLANKIVEVGQEGIIDFLNSGISPEMLKGDGKKILLFILDFWKKYNSLPSFELISDNTGHKIEIVNEPVKYWLDEIKKRVLFEVLKDGLEPVLKHMNDYKPDQAFESIMTLGREMWNCLPNISNIESIFSIGPRLKEYYFRIKEGKLGVPSPWPTLTLASLGWWPGDLIACVGRPATGKTWCMLLLSHAAWVKGYKVLFVCTEMSRLKVAQRFFAIHLKYPADNLRKAKLGYFEEQAFFDSIDELLETKGFYVVGDDYEVNLEVVEGAIYKVSPDFVVIDGLYLVKIPGYSDRTQRMAMAVNEIKNLIKRYGVACAISSQFNRQVKANDPKTADLENIGLSDNIGWAADVAIGLIRTTDMKQDKKMLIKLLKLREGEPKDLVVNWSFDTMDFSEIIDPGENNTIIDEGESPF